jgi:hypothetical protein
MTVKKTLSLKRPTATSVAEANNDATEAPTLVSPPTGAATIADRFKLDTPPPAKSGGADGVATKVAVVAAAVALVVAGVLAYTLFGHWDFLKGA